MPRLRGDHDEADEAELKSGFHGEGGACGAEEWEDAGGVGVVLRCSPEVLTGKVWNLPFWSKIGTTKDEKASKII
jgi:hypothetical protein